MSTCRARRPPPEAFIGSRQTGLPGLLADPEASRRVWTLSMVGAALTQGVTFFASIIHLLTASRPAVVVACLGLVLLATRWSTLDRLRRLFERITGQRPV